MLAACRMSHIFCAGEEAKARAKASFLGWTSQFDLVHLQLFRYSKTVAAPPVLSPLSFQHFH